MKKVILILMITAGFSYAGEGYWDCTQSYGQCTYMKYDKDSKNFEKASHLPKGETVYTFSPLAQHNAMVQNSLAFNTVK